MASLPCQAHQATGIFTDRASLTVAGSRAFFWNLPRPCRNLTPLYIRRRRREQYCLR